VSPTAAQAADNRITNGCDRDTSRVRRRFRDESHRLQALA